MSELNSIAVLKRSSSNVYEADIFNCSRQVMTSRCRIAPERGDVRGRDDKGAAVYNLSSGAGTSGLKPAKLT